MRSYIWKYRVLNLLNHQSWFRWLNRITVYFCYVRFHVVDLLIFQLWFHQINLFTLLFQRIVMMNSTHLSHCVHLIEQMIRIRHQLGNLVFLLQHSWFFTSTLSLFLSESTKPSAKRLTEVSNRKHRGDHLVWIHHVIEKKSIQSCFLSKIDYLN